MAQKGDERDWWLEEAAGTNEPRTAFVIASSSLASKSATRKPPTCRRRPPPPTPNRRYFALNPIIDKFSFKKGCQVRSAGQYKTGTHCSVYHFKPTATAKCLLNFITSVFVKISQKRARAGTKCHLLSKKIIQVGNAQAIRLRSLAEELGICLSTFKSSTALATTESPHCLYVRSRMSLRLSPLITSESLGGHLLKRVWTSLHYRQLCFCNSTIPAISNSNKTSVFSTRFWLRKELQ